MRITRKELDLLRPYGDWGCLVKGAPICRLCRSYRFEMIATNAKRGAPLHLLVFVPASKLAPEQMARIESGAFFRAVGRIDLWPSRSYGLSDHPPHLFVTNRVEVEAL